MAKFFWKDQELKNITQIMNVVAAIADREDYEEAERFKEAYRKSGVSATRVNANIGYASGYYGETLMFQIQKVFKVAHPILGYQQSYTPKELFEIGMKMGQEYMGRKNEG